MKNNHAFARSAFLLVIGGVAGATIGLLLAPQSGKKSRHRIQRRSRDLVQRIQGLHRQLQGCLEDLAEDSLEIIEKGRDLGDEIKKKVHHELMPGLRTGKKRIARQIEQTSRLLFV